MNFISYSYFIFAAVTLLAFQMAGARRKQILLLASFVFFLSWDWRFLFLHLAVSLAAYSAGRWMTELAGRNRKYLLWSVIGFYAAILFVFKYYNFFMGDARNAVSPGDALLRVVWPIGLSYYTLQSLGYVIDVYLRKSAAGRNLGDFVLFTAFFPQVLIGPIERYGRMAPQIANIASARTQWREGSFLILFGLFKKVVVAERLALLTHFQQGSLTGLQGWGLAAFCVLAYFELYCDFSAYTDIARGTAKLFGIDLIDNFYQPYLAKSPAEIWRRWHHSLVSWLQDYLYWPLLLKIKNIYVTVTVLMLAVGMWHAPTFSFLMWSVYWSAVYCAYLLLRTNYPAIARRKGLGTGVPAIALMLAVSSFSTIFLASAGFHELRANFASFFKPGRFPVENLVSAIPMNHGEYFVMFLGLALMFVAETVQHSKYDKTKFYPAAAVFFLFLVAAFGKSGDFTFIYMKF